MNSTIYFRNLFFYVAGVIVRAVVKLYFLQSENREREREKEETFLSGKENIQSNKAKMSRDIWSAFARHKCCVSIVGKYNKVHFCIPVDIFAGAFQYCHS